MPSRDADSWHARPKYGSYEEEEEEWQPVVRRDGKTVPPEQIAQEREEQSRREREEAERKRREAPKLLVKRWVPGQGVVTVAQIGHDGARRPVEQEKNNPQGETNGRRI